MKTVAAIVLLSCCALSQDKRAISRAEVSCGPQDVKYEVKFDDSQHPTPTPEDGKALIYVVADGDLTSIFGFDEKWEGVVKGGRAPSTGGYFFVPIEPGEHHVCAMLQSSHSLLPGFGVPGSGPRVSVHSLKAEPGGTYYFRTRMVGISTGFVLQLDQLDSDEGRWFVAWSKFRPSHPKD
jgi:hypothetical protein